MRFVVLTFINFGSNRSLNGHSRQITPNMVREAYALLRQSIIHVEQDDIDFEDDIDEVLPAPIEGANGAISEMEIDMADVAAAEAAEATYNASSLPHGVSSSVDPSSHMGQPNTESFGGQSSPVPTAPVAKRKLRITCTYFDSASTP
jgi:DNA replication licensing factor MCM6